MLKDILNVLGICGCIIIMVLGIGATWVNLCFDKWVDLGVEDENEVDSEDC